MPTFEGLAAPLYDVAYHDVTLTGITGEHVHMGGSATKIYAAIGCKNTVSGAYTVGQAAFTGLQAELRYDGTGTAQIYGVMFSLILGAASSDSGGRRAVMQLAFDGETGYSVDGSAAAQSFINFHTRAGHVPSIFTFLTGAWGEVDHTDEYFVTNTASPTHGLRCYVDNVLYYIALQSTHS